MMDNWTYPEKYVAIFSAIGLVIAGLLMIHIYGASIETTIFALIAGAL